MRYTRSSGFTLLELSIVLVIIGLVIGGITVGSEMIQAAKLQKVTQEVATFQTGVNTFRLKFGKWPGDFALATQYWPTATGNGNGDGTIQESMGNPENVRFWEHLSLAGLIPGTYAYNATQTFGTVLPASAYDGGGYTIDLTSAVPIYTKWGTAIVLGSNGSGGAGFSPLMPPDDAQNIDAKMDDGAPSSGLVYTERGWLSSSQAAGCVSGPETATSVTYTLSDPQATCIMVFWFKDR